MTDNALFPVVAVHCFAHCGHVVRDPDPRAAHDAMERHYADKHAALISALAPVPDDAKEAL